jgi:tRNA modification GTPase
MNNFDFENFSREQLIKCLAHTEAVIDFGDDDREGDINDSAMLPLQPVIGKMMKDIEKYLADGRRGEIIREGVQVALVGQPNAGSRFILFFSWAIFSTSF